IRLLFIEATKMDLGDLPSNYKTTWNGVDYSYTTLESGAAHVYTGLRLGNQWDGENDGQVDANAVGDDNNPSGGPDDEDGVQVTTTNEWSAGQQVSVTVTINGGDGCLSAWIDWNKNGAFATTERVITNTAVSTGSYVFTFTVPSGVLSPYVYFSRWRLFPRPGYGTCPSPSTKPLPFYDVTGFDQDGVPQGYAHYAGGEVEDHKIGRAPTAVTLQSFGAASALDWALPVVGVVGVVGALGVFALRRRRN
ncbi:MAG: GEVED domain-containing protein, partial [Anaerolineae bacterium]|nr:GEVED domain-containing protein [Anaerolineae bacterium]